MLKRLMEQEQAINEYALQQRKFDMTFDVAETQMMTELLQILEPLDELTRIFCKTTSPISMKYPCAVLTRKKLSSMNFLSVCIENLRDQFVAGLQSKFDGFGAERYVCVYLIYMLLEI
jgi:hypothetical protein